jgi:hypothetical protein
MFLASQIRILLLFAALTVVLFGQQEAFDMAASTRATCAGRTSKWRAGVNEALEVGEKAGVPVHIFHYKVKHPPMWGRLAEFSVLIRSGPRAWPRCYRR